MQSMLLLQSANSDNQDFNESGSTVAVLGPKLTQASESFNTLCCRDIDKCFICLKAGLHVSVDKDQASKYTSQYSKLVQHLCAVHLRTWVENKFKLPWADTLLFLLWLLCSACCYAGVYVVCSDYRSRQHDELSLEANTVVDVLETRLDGWWSIR